MAAAKPRSGCWQACCRCGLRLRRWGNCGQNGWSQEVVACDNDQDALLSARTNAELNNVSLAFADDVARLDNGFDLILMADVLYDKSNYPLLQMPNLC